jgi:hypothetical protein
LISTIMIDSSRSEKLFSSAIRPAGDSIPPLPGP